MNGYEKLMAAVQKDCNSLDHCGCFNPNGCDKDHHQIGKYGEPGYKCCMHKYCDKFKWVIDRAKHYKEKTGVPWESILDAWETDRSYWYMNYYQQCNQPEIKGDNVRVFETVEDFRKSVDGRYRCPHCGGISTDPCECNAGGCDWKIYGLIPFGAAYVFIKDTCRVYRIFHPVAWEAERGKENGEGKGSSTQHQA